MNKKGFYFLIIAAVAAIALLLGLSQPVEGSMESAGILCGNGSASENYGFTYNLSQEHWVVGWENYVAEETINQVDVILDRLTADHIAETMILMLPVEQVGNRVNCAVHFLRYMQLGLPEGERKDNGFVFLIAIDENKIYVHYGVGLGLPALTAHNLTSLNRLAETTYANTGSMDKALLDLVTEYDAYTRSEYAPWFPPSPTQPPASVKTTNSGMAAVLCLICVGVIILIVFLFFLSRIFRGISGGSHTQRPGSGFRPSSIPRLSFPRPSFPRPSIPRPTSRRGSGSGRSGRGN